MSVTGASVRDAALPLVRRVGPVRGEHWDLANADDDAVVWREPDDLRHRHARGLEAWTAAVSQRLDRPATPVEPGGVLHLAPGVRMWPVPTPTLPPATHTNVFMVGHARAFLVEPAAMGDDVQGIVAWVDGLRAGGLRLEGILLTHHHADHIGGAAQLRESLGAPLCAHPATAERLAPGLRVDVMVHDDDVLPLDHEGRLRLRAVHTPGHAPGHLCFLEESSGVLLAGDMVAGTGTILVEPIDGDMAAYLHSLRRLALLDVTAIAPAHGGVLRPARETFERYVAHRLAREARVVAALCGMAGDASVSDLVPVAYADSPSSLWPLAALSVEAHLVKLRSDGRVHHDRGRWRVAST